MKKLILFLLLPLWAMAQTTTGQEQEFDYGIKNNSTQTITTPPYLGTFGTDGTQGKIPSAYIEKTDNKQNSLSVDGTGTKYPTVDAVNAALPVLQAQINSKADLDGSGKVPLTQINDALLGSVNYKGTYNANTDTPAIPTAASSNKGWYYVVSTAGTQQGFNFVNGDWIISNGTSWGKVDNNNTVTSVNGQVGAVNLTKSDVGLSNVDNTSDVNKPISTATQTALNLKQNTLTNPITGTLTANYIPKATGSGTLGNSLIYDNGTNVGIGTNSPTDGYVAEIVGVTRLRAANYQHSLVISSLGGDILKIGGGAVNGGLPMFSSPSGEIQILPDSSQNSKIFSFKADGFHFSVGTSNIWGEGNQNYINLYQGGNGSMRLVTTTNNNITFNPNNVEKARFSYDGNLLLNTTTDNGVDALQVNGSISATSYTGGASLTGTPTAPTAPVGTTGNQIATLDYVNANTRPYKVWTGIISQNGTNAPTVQCILENTLGGTIVWSRLFQGYYTATLTGAFIADKTFCIISQSDNGYTSSQCKRADDNSVYYNTIDVQTGVTTDDREVSIEIRVYN